MLWLSPGKSQKRQGICGVFAEIKMRVVGNVLALGKLYRLVFLEGAVYFLR